MTFATCHLWLGSLFVLLLPLIGMCAKISTFRKEKKNMLYGLRYELTASDLHELEIVKGHLVGRGRGESCRMGQVMQVLGVGV